MILIRHALCQHGLGRDIMIAMILSALLSLFLLLPSLLEGVGLWADRRAFLLFFSIVPILLYSSLSSFFHPIKIPLKAGIAFFCFLFFSGISTFFFSFDKQASFELLLFYYSSFLLFIFFYNHKKEGTRFAHYFPVILGIFFACYSLLLPFLRQGGVNSLLPVIEKQFIFPSYSGHNHLGDFLGLLLIILLFYGFKKKWVILPFLFFFAMFLVSFSRSAYIALFAVCILMLAYARKKISSSFLPFIFLFLSLIVFTTYLLSAQQPARSPLARLQSYARITLALSPRAILSEHDTLMKQALSSIQKHPFFGIGGGNFIIASQQNEKNDTVSDSVHTIFLELATEQGILATLCFLLFIIFISRHILSFPSLPGFLFLYLLVNFQTDYTYQIYSLFLFWIILSSLSYSEKQDVSISSFAFGLFSLIPLVILTCITTSILLLKMGDYNNAIHWYPANKQAYEKAIQQSSDQTPLFIAKAEQIAPYDPSLISSSAAYYLKHNNKKEALRYFEKMYEINHFCSFNFIKQIYTLKKELRSQAEADYFFNGIVRDYQHIFVSYDMRVEFANFCKEAKMGSCPKIGWNDQSL